LDRGILAEGYSTEDGHLVSRKENEPKVGRLIQTWEKRGGSEKKVERALSEEGELIILEKGGGGLEREKKKA